ncbi:MAG TPA: LpxD N-terminal domain-containing protein, partial [Pyrinomonadaceae bacterium]|nr:LpxD N-terminal domain-containing protein [Pyrinomonadaceae bacterium]
MKLSELAELTGAQLEGEAELEINGAAGLDEAGPGHVTFLANPRYTPRVQTTHASAIYLAAGVETGRATLAVLRAR